MLSIRYFKFIMNTSVVALNHQFCTCVKQDFPRNVIKNEVLENFHGDLSEFAPNHSPSYNLAAYVNKSDTLQKLMKLNVNLARIEKKPHIGEKILKLDFDKDIVKHIFFLKDYIHNEKIGEFITKNPMILFETIEDLEVRINYLQSKFFTGTEISRILTKNPFWLMFSTLRIDKRLGYFQKKFSLTGNEVRYLTTKQPQLITYNLHHVTTNTFVIREEFGFNDNEVKELLLKKPKLWMMNQKILLERFNFIHNIMKIQHESILQNANILTYRNFIVKQRHLFLQKLGRAQYDPMKENYINLDALCNGTDIEFCAKYAKCNVQDFNTFLKTL